MRNGRLAKNAMIGLTVLVAGSWAWVGTGNREVFADTKDKPSQKKGEAAACPTGMVKVEGGNLSIGSKDGHESERYGGVVQVKSFCMDQKEVTVETYAKCVSRGDCESAPTTVDWKGISEGTRNETSIHCNGNRSDRYNHPVNCVTWDQAVTFCKKSTKRLPSEEEWEYAARGREGRIYPWGNAEPDKTLLNAWGTDGYDAAGLAEMKARGHIKPGWGVMYVGNDGFMQTAPVGNFYSGRSLSGLDDMAGNVREWTSSGYSGSYKEARTDDRRVTRGGGYFDTISILARATTRIPEVPSVRKVELGFRCTKSLP